MVMVLVLVALASVLSYALLSSQSMMMQASANSHRAAQADALAESGIQLASYYLQNPASAPVLNGSGFYPGQTGVSFGSAVDGTVDIVVTRIDNSTFDIASTSHYGTASSSPLARSLGARASVQYAYLPTEAATVNGGLNVLSNTTITGAVRANGTVNLSLGGTINGTIYAPSVTGILTGLLGSIVTTTTSGGSNNPTPIAIRDYSTYTYNGQTYRAKLIASASATLGATSDNPLGVYVAAGDLTITSAATINGTLLVPNGKLIVKSSNLTINAATNMPALIVKSDIAFSGNARKLTVNGLSWIGGVLTKSGTTSGNITVFNGAAQFASGTPITSNYSGTVKINYDARKAAATGFLPGQGTTASAVTIKTFNNK